MKSLSFTTDLSSLNLLIDGNHKYPCRQLQKIRCVRMHRHWRSPTVQSERSRSTRLRRAPIPEPTSGGEWSVRAESPPREEIIARGRVAADGPRQFGTDGGDTVALAICRTRAGEGVEGGICRDGDAGESDLERNCGGGVLRCRRCLLTTESPVKKDVSQVCTCKLHMSTFIHMCS